MLRRMMMAQPSGGGGDPYFANVVLLAHMDGADGSTTFTDSSSYARTITPAGNAQIDTAESMFGGASALFDGTGDSLRCAQSADFQIFSANFTMEGWWRKSVNTGNQCLIEIGSSSANRLNVSIASGDILVFAGGGSGGSVRVTSAAPAVNTWHAWAVVANAGTVTLYVNGTSVGTFVATNLPTGDLYCDVGRSILGGGSDYAGWLDEIRVTKGVARYTANYTPAGPFPNS